MIVDPVALYIGSILITIVMGALGASLSMNIRYIGTRLHAIEDSIETWRKENREERKTMHERINSLSDKVSSLSGTVTNNH